MNNQFQIEIDAVSKRFGNTQALDSVSLSIAPGSIHSLLGENGAGKSTLLNLLIGSAEPDSGRIIVKDSTGAKLTMGKVSQLPLLIHSFTGVENLQVGAATSPWSLRSNRISDRYRELCKRYSLDVRLDLPVGELNPSDRQKIEILKLLDRDVDLLLFDEPTSHLSGTEAQAFFTSLGNLKSAGKTIIVVTHDIDVAVRNSDSITVLKSGRVCINKPVSEITRKEIFEKLDFQSVLAVRGDVQLYKSHPLVCLHSVGFSVDGASFSIEEEHMYSGEIVGVNSSSYAAALKLLEIIVGRYEPDEGAVTYHRSREKPHNLAEIPPQVAIDAVEVTMKIWEVVALRRMREVSHICRWFLRRRKALELAQATIRRGDVKAEGTHAECGDLSGGNLQRLIIGRELERQASVIVAANPSAGLDTRSLVWLAAELRAHARNGGLVILATPNQTELHHLADRQIKLCEVSES